MRVIADRTIESSRGDTLKAKLEELRGGLITDLANALLEYRLQQYDDLISWLTQLERLRLIDKAEKVGNWLIDSCVNPLREIGDDQYLDGFEFSIRRWQLAVLNHKGNILEAAVISKRMDELAPRIAGRWEFAQVLMESLVVQAVHLTDTFDFQGASDKAGRADAYHMQLANTFSDLYKVEVKADGRGKALSTWAQSEMYASLSGGALIQDAREINELAIDQFEGEGHKSRLYQYRSQIESISGEFHSAREWLAKSLRLSDTSHLGKV